MAFATAAAIDAAIFSLDKGKYSRLIYSFANQNEKEYSSGRFESHEVMLEPKEFRIGKKYWKNKGHKQNGHTSTDLSEKRKMYGISDTVFVEYSLSKSGVVSRLSSGFYCGPLCGYGRAFICSVNG